MVKRPSEQVIAMAVDSVDSNQMHTVRETASLINLSTDYLRDLINMGRVEAVKPFGGHLRIYREGICPLGGRLSVGEIPHPANHRTRIPHTNKNQVRSTTAPG